MKRFALTLLLLAALSPAALAASGDGPAQSRWLRELGVSAGYGRGPVSNGSYEFISLLPRVGLDLGEVTRWAGLGRPPGTLELVFEPLFNVVNEPGWDFEAGAGLLFKYGLRLGPFMPYLEAGGGIVFAGDQVPEQSGGCNFIPQVGPGLHIFVSPNWALDLGYRFRHLSNSGLSKPNHGVNSDLFLIGVSFLWAPSEVTN